MVLTGCLTRRMGLAGPRRAGAVMFWNGMATYGSLAAGAPLGMLLYQKVGQCRLCPYSLWLCVYCHAVVIRQPPGSLWGGRVATLSLLLESIGLLLLWATPDNSLALATFTSYPTMFLVAAGCTLAGAVADAAQ